MVDEDVMPEQVAVFGFSQGTMMSLQVVPRREDSLARLIQRVHSGYAQDFNRRRSRDGLAGLFPERTEA